MKNAKPRFRRCAIYTRKSSEEGLQQNFNSPTRPARGVRGAHHEPSERRPASYPDSL